jgi:hypothetical protein
MKDKLEARLYETPQAITNLSQDVLDSLHEALGGLAEGSK